MNWRENGKTWYNSEDSYEKVNLLAAAKTHSQLFCGTGGSHITSDDFFMAIEVPNQTNRMTKI